MFTASEVVSDVIGCLTGVTGIASAAVVIGVLQPLLLVLLLAAQLPGAWSAVRSARIRYVTQFALTDASRRKWILATLMADRRTAAVFPLLRCARSCSAAWRSWPATSGTRGWWPPARPPSPG